MLLKKTAQVSRCELTLTFTLQHVMSWWNLTCIRVALWYTYNSRKKAVRTDIRQNTNVIYTRETSPINIAIPEKISSSAQSLSHIQILFIYRRSFVDETLYSYLRPRRKMSRICIARVFLWAVKSQWKHIKRPVFLKSTWFILLNTEPS